MDLWLNIIQMSGSFVIFLLCLDKNIPIKKRVIIWFVCLVMFVTGGFKLIREESERQLARQKQHFYEQSWEKTQLLSMGLPFEYVGGLGENPLLKHHYNEGQKYRGEGKFVEAITEYKECLNHPKASIKNRVAASLLIGHCYDDIGDYHKADSVYKVVLIKSEEITDEREKVKARGVALCNLGLNAVALKKYQDGLKYLNECLETTKQTASKEGQLACYMNLGSIYGALGNFDSTLSYYEKALQIAKKLPNKEWERLCCEGIGLVYGHKGDFNRAIDYFLKEEQLLKEGGKISELKELYKDLSFSYYKIGDSRNAEKYRKLAGD